MSILDLFNFFSSVAHKKRCEIANLKKRHEELSSTIAADSGNLLDIEIRLTKVASRIKEITDNCLVIFIHETIRDGIVKEEISVRKETFKMVQDAGDIGLWTGNNEVLMRI